MSAKKYLAMFIVFTVLLCIAHLRHFNQPFLFDDSHSIQDNQAIRSLANIPAFFSDPSLFSSDINVRMYRPILLTTYAINFAISKHNPWSYRLFNILIHAINAILLSLLFYKRIGEKASIVASLVFLLNPLAERTFNHVSTRSALLLTMFLLITMYWYIRSRDESGSRSWKYYAGAIAATLLCFLTVSAAVSIPVFIFAIEMAGDKKGWKRFGFVAPFVLITLGYILFRKSIMGSAFGTGYVRPIDVNAAQQIEIFWLYIKKIFIPVDYPLYHLVDDTISFTSPGVIVALIAAMLWAIVGVIALLKKNFVGVAIVWPLVAFFPYAAIPLNVPVAEHHFYPSLAGVAIIVVWAYRNVIEIYGSKLAPVFAVIIICWMGILNHRDGVWRSEITLLGDSVRQEPNSARAWNDLGSSFTMESRYREAKWAFDASIALKPNNPPAFYNRGLNYFYQDDYAHAIEDLMHSQDLTPGAGSTGYTDGIIGMAFARLGKPRLALPYLDSGIEENPDLRETRLSRAEVYLMLNRPQKTILDCNELIKKLPNDVEALKLRMNAFLLIDVTEARNDLDRVKALGVAGPEINILEANLLMTEKRYDEAAAIISAELQKSPESVQLWALLGRCMEQSGKKDLAIQYFEKALNFQMPPAQRKSIENRILELKAAR